MYLNRPGQVFAAGHERRRDRAGDALVPRRRRDRAVLRPVRPARQSERTAGPVNATICCSAAPLTKTYNVPANGRFTIWVDDEEIPAGSGVKPLDNVAVSTTITSTNGVPIIVERTMWWPPGADADYWTEAHNSAGRDGDRHALGAGRGRSRAGREHRDLHPDRQHVGVRRHGAGDAVLRGRHARPSSRHGARRTAAPTSRLGSFPRPRTALRRSSKAWARRRRKSSSSGRCIRPGRRDVGRRHQCSRHARALNDRTHVTRRSPLPACGERLRVPFRRGQRPRPPSDPAGRLCTILRPSPPTGGRDAESSTTACREAVPSFDVVDRRGDHDGNRDRPTGPAA